MGITMLQLMTCIDEIDVGPETIISVAIDEWDTELEVVSLPGENGGPDTLRIFGSRPEVVDNSDLWKRLSAEVIDERMSNCFGDGLEEEYAEAGGSGSFGPPVDTMTVQDLRRELLGDTDAIDEKCGEHTTPSIGCSTCRRYADLFSMTVPASQDRSIYGVVMDVIPADGTRVWVEVRWDSHDPDGRPYPTRWVWGGTTRPWAGLPVRTDPDDQAVYSALGDGTADGGDR